MQTTTNQLAAHSAIFPPLEQVTRPILTTEEAAYYLNRRPQTLRIWSMSGAPIAPIRINSRLGWKVSDIKALLNGGV